MSLFDVILLNVHALGIILIATAKLILYYHIQQQMVQNLYNINVHYMYYNNY